MTNEDKKSNDSIGFFKGSHNIVGKDIIVAEEINIVYLNPENFKSLILNQCGLTMLLPNHFNRNVDTKSDFEGWKNDGFPFFMLESIYQRLEFRRETLLNDIKAKLEHNGRILLLGEAGTSKTTILMELICDYHSDGFRVLYSLDDELGNSNAIYEFISGLALADNKILIVIDNVHSKKMSSIFKCIQKCQSLEPDKLANIRFVLAARRPDFDWIFKKVLFESETIEIIEAYFNENYKFPIPYFELEEVIGFVRTYGSLIPNDDNISVEKRGNQIFNDTKGYPIMVRFMTLNSGLETHVKKIYRDYFISKTGIDNYPDVDRIKTITMNSLFDISNLALRDKHLENCHLLDFAEDLVNSIIKKSDGVWRTIHPKWDMEFINYLAREVRGFRIILIDVVKCILLNNNIPIIDKIIILNTLFSTLVKERVIDLDLISKAVSLHDIELTFENHPRALIYSDLMGLSYLEEKRYIESVTFFQKAIEADKTYFNAYYNKGLAYYQNGSFSEAIVEYDNAIRLNKRDYDVYYNKGLALTKLNLFTESIIEFDNAIKLSPNSEKAYSSKGYSLVQLGLNKEAMVEFDNALLINPKFTDAIYNMGAAFAKIGQHSNAIAKYSEVLRINPNHFYATYNIGLSLIDLEKYIEAIKAFDDAIRLDPGFENAYYHKGFCLSRLNLFSEAIVEYDNAIRLNPQDYEAYHSKGICLHKLGKDEEAIVEYDNAIRLNKMDSQVFRDKGISLHNLGSFEAAIQEFENGLKLNPPDIELYNAKGLSLHNLGSFEAAIQEFDKALAIDNSYSNAIFNKGRSLSGLLKFEEAIIEYDKVIQINPLDARAKALKGSALIILNKLPEASYEIETSLGLDSNCVDALLGKTTLLYYANQMEEAKKTLRKVFELEPNNMAAKVIKMTLDKTS